MKDYDNFFLPVNNLEKAKEYYQKLGLSIKFDFSDNGMVAFKVGSQEPAIILKDTKKFPNTKPTIWFLVDDVRVEFKRLKERGIRFLSEPFEIHTGLAAEFEDPFGNRLGITDYSKQKGGQRIIMKIKIRPDSTHTLDYHFRGDRKAMKPLYDVLIGRLSREMDFEYKIGKSYIGLIKRLVFAAIRVQTKKMILEFTPRKEFKSPRIFKSVQFQKQRWAQYVEIKSIDDIDQELINWVKFSCE